MFSRAAPNLRIARDSFGHACSPRRIPGMALSHAPMYMKIFMVVFWVLNISIRATDKPTCSQITPSILPQDFLASDPQSCSQRSSQLVTPVYP